MRKVRQWGLPATYRKNLNALQTKWSADATLRATHPKWSEDVWRGAYRIFLQRIHHGRCAFCDTLCIAGTNGQVEHFLPKFQYHDKKFVWDNWILACKNCNTAKGMTDTGRDTWVDPRKHNPSVYIAVLSTGTLVARYRSGLRRQMAMNTINGADLNCIRTKRPKVLPESRQAVIFHLQGLIHLYIKLKAQGITGLVDDARDCIINYCSDRDRDFTGVLLSWLLSKVREGVIEHDIYKDAYNKYISSLPDKSQVFS